MISAPAKAMRCGPDSGRAHTFDIEETLHGDVKGVRAQVGSGRDKVHRCRDGGKARKQASIVYLENRACTTGTTCPNGKKQQFLRHAPRTLSGIGRANKAQIRSSNASRGESGLAPPPTTHTHTAYHPCRPCPTRAPHPRPPSSPAALARP